MKSAGEEEEENQQCLKFFGEREKIQNAAVLLCVFVISVYDANISIISIFFCGDDDNNYLKAKTNKSIVSITKYHGENSNRKADMSLSLVHTHTTITIQRSRHPILSGSSAKTRRFSPHLNAPRKKICSILCCLVSSKSIQGRKQKIRTRRRWPQNTEI